MIGASEPKETMQWQISILIVLGFLVYFALFPSHQLLDWYSFFTWSAIVAVPLIIAIHLARFKFMEAWGSFNRIFAIMLYTLGFSAAVLHAINITLDTSMPVSHYASIQEKHYSRGKSAHYYVSVNDWRDTAKSFKVSVNSDFYNKARAGSRMNVKTRHGALGFEYVDSYQ